MTIREIIKNESWLGSTDLLVLDEIHKMPDWKNYIKGVYDTRRPELKILVTGSARLEYFRLMGDSLSGRFFTHRLYPFSLGELATVGADVYRLGSLDHLMNRGGFPEPFLAEDETFVRRWRKQYVDGLIREDVLENLTALALAKEAAADEDLRGISASLNYLRTKDGQEAEFCYVRDGKAQFLVETKYADANISKNLFYFCSRYGIPGIQLVKDLKQERQEGNIEVRSADDWLSGLE